MRVSIGIPAYNSKDYITEAIESALSQTYSDFELIISDDRSTDGTEDICRGYARKDSRIRYIRQEKNLGGHFNANFVLQEAQGEYFTWLGHDDVLEKNFLEETISYLDNHPHTLLVSGDFEIIDEHNSTLRIDQLEKIREHIPWQKRSLEFFKYPIAKSFFCFYGLARTPEIQKIFTRIPTKKKIIKGAEMLFLSRVAMEGEIVSIPQILRKYRQHSESEYNKEVRKMKLKSSFSRRFALFVNLYRVRFDQLKVLFFSCLSISQKMYIFSSVSGGYIFHFLSRIFLLPKKILRT